MRGPIDYVVVGFDGVEFNGKILGELQEAVSKGVIDIIALAFVAKDNDGNVTTLDVLNDDDEYLIKLSQTLKDGDQIIDQDDIDELGDILDNNTAAGLLVVEQLWAKPFKQALIDANGMLIAEGRIHPDAADELNDEEEK